MAASTTTLPRVPSWPFLRLLVVSWIAGTLVYVQGWVSPAARMAHRSVRLVPSTSSSSTALGASKMIPLISTLTKASKKLRDSVSSKERTREELKSGIAAFYDRSSQLWEQVWGEHMHHGACVFGGNGFEMCWSCSTPTPPTFTHSLTPVCLFFSHCDARSRKPPQATTFPKIGPIMWQPRSI